MATPILTALRQAYPEAHLTWVVEYKEAAVLDANPYLDELLLWDTAYWKRLLRTANYPLYLVQANRLRRQLCLRDYDIFISYQPEEWCYLVTRACNAPVRLGVFDMDRESHGATQTHPNTKHFTRSYVQPQHPPHRTDRYLLPLEALGLAAKSKRMLMGFENTDRTTVERWMRENGIQTDRFVTIAPLATWPSWEATKFASLAEAMRGEGYGVVFIGSSAEAALVAEIADSVDRGVLTAPSTFTFREKAALLDQAALVISGDTVFMHLAAALARPFLSLFGPTTPKQVAPLLGVGALMYRDTPCSPCYKAECPLVADHYLRCLRPLRVEEVLAVARKLLSEPRPSWE